MKQDTAVRIQLPNQAAQPLDPLDRLRCGRSLVASFIQAAGQPFSSRRAAPDHVNRAVPCGGKKVATLLVGREFAQCLPFAPRRQEHVLKGIQSIFPMPQTPEQKGKQLRLRVAQQLLNLRPRAAHYSVSILPKLSLQIT